MHENPTTKHRVGSVPVRSLRVEVMRGPDKGRRVARPDLLTIGTAPGNDLVLTDETISRYHLEIQRDRDRILVQDHGSTNGTAFGPILIERAVVSPGAQLEMGRSVIKLDDGDVLDVEVLEADALGPLRGRSPAMRRLMATVDRAARSDVSVLITGPTGTGKEVIAHAIHETSRRVDRSFVTVDCGALMPTLVASELFGHEKGAFTGAERQHLGAFERADGGTIFLDEIGELSSSLQAALLGVLERRRFRRLGGDKDISVDVRVVAATHRDLRAEVNAGTFRQDLYYRLGVLHLRVPPLADRPADIPLLVEHFLREAGYGGPVENIIPPSSMDVLRQHRWPGNARELRNWVEATLAMGQMQEIEQEGDPNPAEVERVSKGVQGNFSMPLDNLLGRPWKDARAAILNEFEGVYLRDLFERTKANVSLAAREADMNRAYLIQMLKRHGLK